ncbi:hypothetical protein BDZ85DRAFT_112095 [Elsinoe ampelina]|uniref:Uncharacterized protein n=1 Tax=Elsinoe ampelina TaxID=302913 RepID=A0A6A6GD50_9PEZI|nr:hypothetical protein BDZ85DRAFT_112095 [Elsinoe ampelina]
MSILSQKRSIGSFDRDLAPLITFPSRKLVQQAIQNKHYRQGYTSTDETIYHVRFKMHDDYLDNRDRIEHNLSRCPFFQLPRELRDRIWNQYFEDNYDFQNGIIPILYVCRLIREECFLLFVNRYQPKVMAPTMYVRWKTYQDPAAGIKAPTMFLLDKHEEIIGFQMSFYRAAIANSPRFAVQLDFFCVDDGRAVQSGIGNLDSGLRLGRPGILELARCILNGALSVRPGHLSMESVQAIYDYAAKAALCAPLTTFGYVRHDFDYTF